MSKTQTKRLKRKAAQAKHARRNGEKRFVPSKDMLMQMSEQMADMRKSTKAIDLSSMLPSFIVSPKKKA